MIRFSRIAPGALLGALVVTAVPAHGQSLFSTRGLGVPNAPVDARSAALGGIGLGLIGFNTALINPADVAGITRRGVAAALQPVSGRSEVAGESDGSSGTRFPLIRIIYPVSQRTVLSAAYGSYLEQSWALQTAGEHDAGDRIVPTTDLTRSSGGVAQLRFGAAYSLTPTLAVGAAAGLLTGSVERSVTRTYADTAGQLRPFSQRMSWQYSAPIAVVGARWDLAGRVRLSASVLAGGDLEASGRDGGADDRTYGAPLEISTGASARLSSLLMATAGAVRARTPDAGGTTVSQETWRVGGGLEYQGVRSGARTYPLRLGVRWAELPYHLEDESLPTEFAVGGGIGFRLGDPSDPAAVADIALERASRSGLAGAAVPGGLDERLWRFTFSLSLFGR